MVNERSFSTEQKVAIADYLKQLDGVHSLPILRQKVLELRSAHESSPDQKLIDEVERIKKDEIETRLEITTEMQGCNTAEDVEEVYRRLLTKHSQEEAYLERYLNLRKGELLNIERQQAEDLERVLDIWGQYKAYRQFRADSPDVGVEGEAEKDFLKEINKQFSQPKNPEDGSRSLWETPSIDGIYRLAYRIEQELKEDKLEFDKIEQDLILLELASRIKKSGNSRTRIVYSRMAEKVEGVKKQLGEEVCTHTVAKLKKRLKNKENRGYLKNLAQAINSLLNLLTYLREKKASIINCGDSPNDPWSISDKELLIEMLQNLKTINKQTRILQKLTKTAKGKLFDKNGLGRLRHLYNKAVREAEILLGEYTGDLFSRDMESEDRGQNVLWEDVRVWLVYQSGLYEDIRKVGILWNQHRAKNLIDRDSTRIKSLLDRIRDVMDDLDQSDVAYEQRFAALDVQINRLLEMKKALEGLIEEEEPIVSSDEILDPDETENEEKWKKVYRDRYERASKYPPEWFIEKARYILNQVKTAADPLFKSRTYFREWLGMMKVILPKSKDENPELWEKMFFLFHKMNLLTIALHAGHHDSLTIDVEKVGDPEIVDEDKSDITWVSYDVFLFSTENREAVGKSVKDEPTHPLQKDIRELFFRGMEILFEEPDSRQREEYPRSWKDVGGQPIKGRFHFKKWAEGDTIKKYWERLEWEISNDARFSHLVKDDKKEVYEIVEILLRSVGPRADGFVARFFSGATPTEYLGNIRKNWEKSDYDAYEGYQRAVNESFVPMARRTRINSELKRTMQMGYGFNVGRVENLLKGIGMTEEYLSLHSPLRERYEIRMFCPDQRFSSVQFYDTAYPSIIEMLFKTTSIETLSGETINVVARWLNTETSIKYWIRKDALGKSGLDRFAAVSEKVRSQPIPLSELINDDGEPQMDSEKARKRLLASLHDLIEKKISPLKAAMFVVDWNKTAVAVVDFIDRMFACLALVDSSQTELIKMLYEIRIYIAQQEKTPGVAKNILIDPLTPNQHVDLTTYILHSFPVPKVTRKFNLLKVQPEEKAVGIPIRMKQFAGGIPIVERVDLEDRDELRLATPEDLLRVIPRIDAQATLYVGEHYLNLKKFPWGQLKRAEADPKLEHFVEGIQTGEFLGLTVVKQKQDPEGNK